MCSRNFGKVTQTEDRKCACNVTLLPWESIKYCIFWVCVCSFRYPACKAHAPYYGMWRLGEQLSDTKDFCLSDNQVCYYCISCFWLKVFRRVRKITKCDYYLGHVCLSVRPHGTTLLPLDTFSWKLIFEYFSKICRENPSFDKNSGTWREHQFTFIISRSVLLRVRNVEDKRTENHNTFWCSVFFSKIVPFMR